MAGGTCAIRAESQRWCQNRTRALCEFWFSIASAIAPATASRPRHLVEACRDIMRSGPILGQPIETARYLQGAGWLLCWRRRQKQTPAGSADRGYMWMKSGGRFYARWLLKDHAIAGSSWRTDCSSLRRRRSAWVVALSCTRPCLGSRPVRPARRRTPCQACAAPRTSRCVL
jgi:hypothetical protein